MAADKAERTERDTNSSPKIKFCIMLADTTLVAIPLADPLFPLMSELGIHYASELHVLKANVQRQKLVSYRDRKIHST